LHERPLVWGRPGARSVGVLALPSSAVPASGIGVLLVVGGPQVRVGSHRQFVQTSRRLAAAGHAVLRFDFPGMGDSEGPTVGFEGASPAIAAALDVLQREVPGLRCTVLWGLCDGASAALLFLDEGGRGVDDLVLMNPWVRSAATQAATQVRHYYRERLLDPAFWRKLVRGGVARGAVGEALGTLRRMWRRPSTGDRPDRPGFVERMARAWTAHPGRILLLQSGRDYTAREFDAALATHPAWRAAARHPGLTRVDIAEADHTFSEQVQRRAAEDAMLVWLAAAADRVARDRRQS
jgi:exosortase A-associated hydrolase 1